MEKTLLLIKEKESYFWKNAEKLKNLDIFEVYKKEFSSKWFSRFKRRNPKRNYWRIGILGDWKNHIEEYERVVVLDSAYTKQLDYLLKGKKVYVFFWNKLHLDDKVAHIHLQSIANNAKIYSYSRNDCENYHLEYNTTMYAPASRKNMMLEGKYEYDVIFIGAIIERRITQLDEVLSYLLSMGKKCYVYAVNSEKNRKIDIKPNNFEMKDDYLSYDSYISLLMKSKVILDIDKYEGMGCSLRAMESIFYKRKYITTNPRVKEERFYNKNNVFIWGQDSLDEFQNFLSTSYVELEEEVVEYYLVKNWIERFV